MFFRLNISTNTTFHDILIFTMKSKNKVHVKNAKLTLKNTLKCFKKSLFSVILDTIIAENVIPMPNTEKLNYFYKHIYRAKGRPDEIKSDFNSDIYYFRNLSYLNYLSTFKI